MPLFTTEVLEIYQLLKENKIKNTEVRVISSRIPQPMKILSDFPNLIEVNCNIMCPVDCVSRLNHILEQVPKLKLVTFVISVDNEDEEEIEEPKYKKQRIEIQPGLKCSEFDKLVKTYIPKLIENLGERLKYMTIGFSIIDSDDLHIIILKNGALMIASPKSDLLYETIFQTMIIHGILTGLAFKGNEIYDLEEAEYLGDLTLIALSDTSIFDKKYLADLVYRADTIEILYTPQTISTYEFYSNVIIQGTSGYLKRIKSPMPVKDVELHLNSNDDLEEIHILVQNRDDVDDLKVIMRENSCRPISYVIHYCQYDDDEYWSPLKNTQCDIQFLNIVHTLVH